MRRAGLVVGCLAGLLVLAGCGGSSHDHPVLEGVSTSPSGPYRGAQVTTPYALPDLTLTDDTGQPFSLRQRAAGHVVLLFFGYTHCPDECPTTMATLASALRKSSPQIREQTMVVFVSTDPTRDTPQRLADWLHGPQSFDPGGQLHFVGLTGDWDAVDRAASSLGIPLDRPTPGPGNYEVTHGTAVVGFDPSGAGRVIWLLDTGTDDVVHDLPVLAAST